MDDEPEESDFKKALGGDVVIPDASDAGPLPAMDALGLRDMYDERRAALDDAE